MTDDLSDLPPYGLMNSEWMAGIFDLVPPTFKINGQTPTPAAFRAWVQALAAEIGDVLWPNFDTARQIWTGAAVGGARYLTEADLDLMRDLRLIMANDVNGHQPVPTKHLHFFLEEDGFEIDPATGLHRRPGASYERYDSTLPNALQQQIKQLYFTGLTTLVGALDLQLKEYFQRPRPYQVALQWHRTTFEYRWAKSAVSPSFISGHAFQAAIAGCHVHLTVGDQLDAAAAACWRQFVVDMGDRRVFAGVHYPSDNLGSWFCALRLCEFIFANRAGEAKTFLWEAITQHSEVYRAIKLAASVHQSPYAMPLSWLETEALRR